MAVAGGPEPWRERQRGAATKGVRCSDARQQRREDGHPAERAGGQDEQQRLARRPFPLGRQGARAGADRAGVDRGGLALYHAFLHGHFPEDAARMVNEALTRSSADWRRIQANFGRGCDLVSAGEQTHSLPTYCQTRGVN